MRAFLILSFLFLFISSCDENNPEIVEITITVTPDQAGEVIPTTSLQVVKGTELSLLAMPTEAYTFVEWSGAATSSANPFSITANEDLQINANFLIKNYPLTITTVGNGSVAESIVQSKTDYDHGTIVQLTPVPSENWEFVEWAGDINSTEESLTLTVTDPVDLTAVFRFTTIDPVAITKTNPMKIYMHYMPWFTSGPFDGGWSQHWTMDNRNPEIITDGKREIASHFYPLIGPYSSKDPDLVEYHLLLMKYAGVDAVLIDWYGTYDVFDYRDNLEGSNALIDKMDEVGMDFGIVYEDRTTPNVVNAGQASNIIEAATSDFNYIFSNYFTNPNYVRVDGEPLVLVFTPIEIQTQSAWNTILSNAPEEMKFLSIWGESGDLGSAGDGEYSWVFNGNNNHDQLLRNFYGSINSSSLRIGSAYPGFVDFYEEGGRGNIIGWEIPHNSRQTLDLTLGLASQYNLDHLQLVTFNDFGEGTMFEPTMEFGYDFLTILHDFTGVNNDFGGTDILTIYEMINDLYDKRKAFAGDTAVQDQLNQVFNYLVSLQISEAASILSSLPSD